MKRTLSRDRCGDSNTTQPTRPNQMITNHQNQPCGLSHDQVWALLHKSSMILCGTGFARTNYLRFCHNSHYWVTESFLVPEHIRCWHSWCRWIHYGMSVSTSINWTAKQGRYTIQSQHQQKHNCSWLELLPVPVFRRHSLRLERGDGLATEKTKLGTVFTWAP